MGGAVDGAENGVPGRIPVGFVILCETAEGLNADQYWGELDASKKRQAARLLKQAAADLDDTSS